MTYNPLIQPKWEAFKKEFPERAAVVPVVRTDAALEVLPFGSAYQDERGVLRIKAIKF